MIIQCVIVSSNSMESSHLPMTYSMSMVLPLTMVNAHSYQAIKHHNPLTVSIQHKENASDSAVDDPTSKKLSGFIHYYNVYVLFLFLLAYLLNQLDRYMLTITILPIAQELKFGNKGCLKNVPYISSRMCNATDYESCLNLIDSANNTICKWDYNGHGWDYLILIGPVFIFVYTFAGVFLGFVADSHNRKSLLAFCLVLWSVVTILTGLVTEYWQLTLLRFLLGLSEAGCTPFATSLISDYFPRSHRATAIGIYNFGIYFGYSLCYAVGNHITLANINGQGWRWAFIIPGIPGVALGLLIACTVAEPERMSHQPYEKRSITGHSAETSLERVEFKSSPPISNSFTDNPKISTKQGAKSSTSIGQSSGLSQDKKLTAFLSPWHRIGSYASLRKTSSSTDKQLKGSHTAMHRTGSSTDRQPRDSSHTSLYKIGSSTNRYHRGSLKALLKIGSPTDRQPKSSSQTSLHKTGSSTVRQLRSSSHTALHKTGSSTKRSMRGSLSAFLKIGSPTDRHLRSSSYTSLHKTGSSTVREPRSSSHTALHKTGSFSRVQLKVSPSKQKLKAGIPPVQWLPDYPLLLKNISSSVDKQLKGTQATLSKYSSSMPNLKASESNLNLKIFPWIQYLEGSSVDTQQAKPKPEISVGNNKNPEGSPIDPASYRNRERFRTAPLPLAQRLQIILFAFTRPSLILLSSAGSVRHAAGYSLAYYAQLYFEASHISKVVIASYMSWIPLVFGSLGVLGGGCISDKVVKKKKIHARVAVIIASQILASPFAACVLYLESPYSFFSLIPALILGEMWIAVVLTVVVEVVPREIRVSSIAVYLFITTNFGGNLPLVVPLMTYVFENYKFNHHDGMRGALLVMYPGFFILSGIIFFLAMLVMMRNEQES
ncbi:hypothetical protein Btru_009903 [Bulinus truncatus]|nr:hypothetical protein Btru_009903 [Bulinus truncatus]